jgi:hypothetical protein
MRAHIRHVVKFGEVPEWLNGAVSKTAVVLVATEGSNPSLSAKKGRVREGAFFVCPPGSLLRGWYSNPSLSARYKVPEVLKPSGTSTYKVYDIYKLVRGAAC